MAGLVPYLKGQLRQIGIEAYNAEAALPANTDENSSLGSLFDAFEMLCLLIQQQIIYENLIARLGTIPANADGSPNPDVDSFCEPWIGPRLGATPATGAVTVTLPSPVSGPSPLVQPVGAIASTSDGRQFITVPDLSGGTPYSPSLGGWPIYPGYSTVNVFVQAVAPGTVGNVGEGQIKQNGGGFLGGPALSNGSALTNGVDIETDAQYKTRFTLAVQTGVTATASAYAAAILGVEPGLTYSVGDRLNASGATTNAYFTIVVAVLGASTSTPAGIITAVTQALEGTNPGTQPVRAQGIQYAVIGPTLIAVNVAATIKVAAGYNSAAVQAGAVAAFDAFVSNLGLDPAGASIILDYLQVGAILYAVPGVQRVDSLTLNSGTADLTATFAQMFYAGTATFTMT